MVVIVETRRHHRADVSAGVSLTASFRYHDVSLNAAQY
jgi:hypothetical protein